VVTIYSPGKPKSIREGAGNNLNGDVMDSWQLFPSSHPMVAIYKVVTVFLITDHGDRRELRIPPHCV
jgi:hypothetical protein